MNNKMTETICKYESDQLLELFHITDNDIHMIQQFAEDLQAYLDTFIDEFYKWLKTTDEYKISGGYNAKIHATFFAVALFHNFFDKCQARIIVPKLTNKFIDSGINIFLPNKRYG